MTIFFETIRRANTDWYTANPLTNLSAEEMEQLAEQTGMTVHELRRHLTTPHIEMTCPLCGQPQTHLVSCKGCGGGAWSGEFEMAHGQAAATLLRDTLRERLASTDQQGGDPCFSPDQIEHAVSHAYTGGGCMVCATCWHHTLPTEAFRTCPLQLLSEILLSQSVPVDLLLLLWGRDRDEENEENGVALVVQWVESVLAHWTEHWNTETGDTHEAIAHWRTGLLFAAFTVPTNEEETNVPI